jgi:biopolymer transport protein ExbB
MNTKLVITPLLFLFLVSSGYSALFGDSKAKKKDARLIQRISYLSTRVKALQKERDSLEARRWQEKYNEVEERKVRENKIKTLDNKYNNLLNKKNSAEESLLRIKQELVEEEGRLQKKREARKEFSDNVKTTIEQYRERTSLVFPADTEDRIHDINGVTKTLENNDIRSGLSEFFTVLRRNFERDEIVSMGPGRMIMEDGTQFNARMLRLGTVYIGKVASDTAIVQMLFNTGRLTGTVYRWRSDFTEEIVSSTREAFQGIDKGGTVLLPVDVLQTRKAMKDFTGGRATSLTARAEEFFRSGGVVMVPLMLLVLWALFIVIERIMFFRRKNINARALMRSITSSVKKGNYSAARKVCMESDTSLGRVLVPILDHAAENASRASAEKAVEEAMLKEVPDLERRISTLGVIGSAAPLLGLLGTVAGMITLFKVITVYGTNDPKLLAGGISEALITTETGLIIAIPVMLLHNFLTSRLTRIQDDMSEYSLSLLNQIWE